MRNRAAPIDIDTIKKDSQELAKQTACPYTKVVKYMNGVSDSMTTDRVWGIVKFIADLISNTFKRQRSNEYINKYVQEQNLGVLSSLKMHKQICDVILLQEEVYPLVQKALTDVIAELQPLSQTTNLQDQYSRFERGTKFAMTFQTNVIQALDVRQEQKFSNKNDVDFFNNAVVASRYTQMFKGNPDLNFGYILAQGSCDGFMMVWNVITALPDLYKKKYGRLPTKAEYLELISKNLRTVILPLATTNLLFVTEVVRPVDMGGRYEYFINNALEIHDQNFSLDDKDSLVANQHYLQQVSHRTLGAVQEYIDVQQESGSNFLSDTHIRMWCPAMRAQTADGKRITEQFIQDVLALLDTVYFPYWEK